MMHLGTEGQMKEVAIVSVLLDASSIRDEPKMQRLIDKWQEASDEMESKCNGSNHYDRKTRQLRKGQASNQESLKEEEHIYNAAKLNEMTYQRILESAKDDDEDDEKGEDDDNENRGPRRKKFPYDMW